MTPPFSSHTPVMLNETVKALSPRDGAIYVDATFGAGGYSEAIETSHLAEAFHMNLEVHHGGNWRPPTAPSGVSTAIRRRNPPAAISAAVSPAA